MTAGGILDHLPVSPAPPGEPKPEVPVAGRPRVRKRLGLERISIRQFEKSPDEVLRLLTEAGIEDL